MNTRSKRAAARRPLNRRRSRAASREPHPLARSIVEQLPAGAPSPTPRPAVQQQVENLEEINSKLAAAVMSLSNSYARLSGPPNGDGQQSAEVPAPISDLGKLHATMLGTGRLANSLGALAALFEGV